MVGVERCELARRRRTHFGAQGTLRLALVVLTFGVIATTSRAEVSNKPTAFDFQERTGFPLTWDDRIVGLDALDTDVKGAMVLAGDTLGDWLTVRERIAASAHTTRRAARVVRVFSDQPVYIYKGFALLPDPTNPDAPTNLDKDWNVELNCAGGDPDNFKSARCVSLHRDHVQNRGAIALVLVARTIIVRGENATGGMSLVTMTENLHMGGDALVDLSARQDPAPTLGVGKPHIIFQELVGSPEEEKPLDTLLTATSPTIEPGPANPWFFVDPNASLPNDPLADLQWQLDVARQAVPDYDWSGGDPCKYLPAGGTGGTGGATGGTGGSGGGTGGTGATGASGGTGGGSPMDRETCWKRREARGLAGLDGGSWFGLTLRATPIYSRSLGQPGGHGDKGLDFVEQIACGAAPMKYNLSCHIHNFGCNPDAPNGPPCTEDPPPHPGDECVCHGEACEQTQCSVNYAADSPGTGCAVTCGISPLAAGQRGGQAGPGGRAGVVRVSAVTRPGVCDSFPEDILKDPAKVHWLDERCLNGQGDDGPPGAPVDCDSNFCEGDPNVSVCDSGDSTAAYGPVSFSDIPDAQDLIDVIKGVVPDPGPSPSPELGLINPLVQPTGGAISPKRVFLDVSAGSYVQLAVGDVAPTVPTFDGVASAPQWGPLAPLLLPPSLFGPTLSPPEQPTAMPAILPAEPDETTDDQAFGDEVLAAAAFKDDDGGGNKMKKGPIANAHWKWAKLLRFVRSQIVAANPSLAGCDQHCNELKWVFVDRLARFLVRDSVRAAARKLAGDQRTADAASALVLEAPLRPVRVTFVQPATGGRPTVLMKGGSGAVQIMDGPLKVNPTIVDVCTQPAVSTFDPDSFKNGKAGVPGLGGTGAFSRCAGWHPTVPYVCSRPPLDDHCTRSDVPLGQFVCPDDRCRTLWAFPKWIAEPWRTIPAAWECPPGYPNKMLVSASGLDMDPGPEVSVCPAKIQGEGGVECDAPEGAFGAKPAAGFPAAPEASQVRPWLKVSWAFALHKLHSLELRRRAGRGNTIFKRGDLLGAGARYFSTLAYTRYNEVPLCNSPPCDVCPDDPGQAANDRLKLLCALEQELQVKLDRIMRNENVYGYAFNYVPPASLQTGEPLAQLSLVNLTKGEMTSAKTDRNFWLLYGSILNGKYNEVNDALTKLNNEISFLNDATDSNGTLTLGLALAAQRVHDAALELDQIAKTIKQLQGKKALVKASSGSALIDVADIGAGVGVAALFGFGGPAAAAFGLAIFKDGWDSAKEGSAAGKDTKPQGSQEAWKPFSKARAGVFAEHFNAGLDDDWVKDGKNAALKPLLSGYDPVLQDWLVEFGLKSEASAKQSLGEVLLDAAILAQVMDGYRAAAKLGQAMAERRLEAQKILEVGRRKAQLQASLLALQSIAPGSFPSPEVQYQIADLALLAAASRVDRAGEYFFLLRRGVERDAIPIDPATGQSTLAANENLFIKSDPICQATSVDANSLDVNLMTLDCFEQRVGYLDAYSGGLQSQINALDVQDTTVPFSNWTLASNAQGQPAYKLTLEVTLAKAHRDFRANHRKQKLYDVVFFLQTNDPVPAAIPIRIRRPQTNLDVYWVGENPKPGAAPSPAFVSLDVAHAFPSTAGDLLFQLLRDTSTYQRDAYACNGLDVNSPLGGQLELCKLSNLEKSLLGRAYLEGLSLIGDVEIEVPVSALGGRIPNKLFADLRYTHAVNF